MRCTLIVLLLAVLALPAFVPSTATAFFTDVALETLGG